MNEKLDYLNKYHKGIQIVQENPAEIKEIPRRWAEILSCGSAADRKRKMLDLWKQYVAVELSNTIGYLEENLEDIELVKYGEKYSLLYSIKAPDHTICYYEGKNPVDSVMPSELQKYWDKFPLKLKCFYENVQDGFYYYASESMGLVPLQDIVIFAEEDWGILGELDMPLQINLESTFGIFSSGMGGYVAVDMLHCENNNSTLWFTGEQPEYNINFWDIVDEWIVIGFQT